MNPQKEKEWYKTKGKMQLFRGEVMIRQYNFFDSYNRRRILRIWKAEIKPNEIRLLVNKEVADRRRQTSNS